MGEDVKTTQSLNSWHKYRPRVIEAMIALEGEIGWNAVHEQIHRKLMKLRDKMEAKPKTQKPPRKS